MDEYSFFVSTARISDFILADCWSGCLEYYLFVVCNIIFIGPKYPTNTSFNFENKIIGKGSEKTPSRILHIAMYLKHLKKQGESEVGLLCLMLRMFS